MSNTRTFLVSYDIADDKRLRKTAKILGGYGYRIQKSVFYCRMTEVNHAHLIQEISPVINSNEDQIMLVDLGINPDAIDSFQTIGRPTPSLPKLVIV